jgi:hypothetical protein
MKYQQQKLPKMCPACHAAWIRGLQQEWQQRWQSVFDRLRSCPAAWQRARRAEEADRQKFIAFAEDLRQQTIHYPTRPGTKDVYRDLPAWMRRSFAGIERRLTAADALMMLSRS